MEENNDSPAPPAPPASAPAPPTIARSSSTPSASTPSASTPASIANKSFAFLLGDDIECPVCYETFQADDKTKQPKFLSCAHSLCFSCISSIIASSRDKLAVECPLCRRTTSITKGGIASLRTNDYVLKFSKIIQEEEKHNQMQMLILQDQQNQDIQQQQQQHQHSQSSPSDQQQRCLTDPHQGLDRKDETDKDHPDNQTRMCSACAREIGENIVEASHECVDCGEGLCHGHVLIHQAIPRSAGHVLLEIRTKRPVEKCLHHFGEDLRAFCDEKECQTLVCIECILGPHKNHSIIALNEIVRQWEEKTLACLQDTREKAEELKTAIANIEGTKERIVQACKFAMEKVDKYRGQVIQMVDRSSARIKHEVETVKQKKFDLLERQKKHLENQLGKVEKICYIAEEAIDKRHKKRSSEFLQEKKRVWEKLTSTTVKCEESKKRGKWSPVESDRITVNLQNQEELNRVLVDEFCSVLVERRVRAQKCIAEGFGLHRLNQGGKSEFTLRLLDKDGNQIAKDYNVFDRGIASREVPIGFQEIDEIVDVIEVSIEFCEYQEKKEAGAEPAAAAAEAATTVEQEVEGEDEQEQEEEDQDDQANREESAVTSLPSSSSVSSPYRGLPFEELKDVEVIDKKNGELLVRYEIPAINSAKRYLINVKLQGQPIRHSPFIVAMHDPKSILRPVGRFGVPKGARGNSTTAFYPFGASISKSGIVATTDIVNHNVHLFLPNGELLRVFGEFGTREHQFDHPWGVACDSKDRIIIADCYNQRIQIFDQEGNPLKRFGSKGWRDGEFNFPLAVAVDSHDHIYVTDFHNHRVQVFDSEGRFLRKFGKKGKLEGEFIAPEGIAVDPADGTIAVVDRKNNRIQVFDNQGNFVMKIGKKGQGAGDFDSPFGIALRFGQIIVCDCGNKRLQLFDREGRYLGKADIGMGAILGPDAVEDVGQQNAAIRYLAINDQGRVYVTVPNNNRIIVFE